MAGTLKRRGHAQRPRSIGPDERVGEKFAVDLREGNVAGGTRITARNVAARTSTRISRSAVDRDTPSKLALERESVHYERRNRCDPHRVELA